MDVLNLAQEDFLEGGSSESSKSEELRHFRMPNLDWRKFLEEDSNVTDVAAEEVAKVDSFELKKI